jgi:hypothetical protein
MKEIINAAKEALKARKGWDDRMEVCYRVRHYGMKRDNPQAWQSDTPVKIADGAIDKIKPALVQGVFQADNLATFFGGRDRNQHLAQLAGQWFSGELKQRSNFLTAFVIAIDLMLQNGKSILKPVWDAKRNRLEFGAFDATRVIVPLETTDIQTAPWVVHIHRLSKDEYAGHKKWNQSPEFVKSITGRGENDSEILNESCAREGLTHDTDAQIVVWEIHKKEDGKPKVAFVSPLKPDEPIQVWEAPSYNCPEFPFFAIDAEITDGRFYSPRGVVERSFHEEKAATVMRNLFVDNLRFAAVPMATTEGMDIGNILNYAFRPGDVLPYQLKPFQFQGPPVEMITEMSTARMTGEQLAGVSDYLMGQALNTKERRSATEVSLSAQLASQSLDLRQRLVRDALTKVFRYCWKLFAQFKTEKIEFYYQDNIQELPPEALKEAWEIEPSGNPDGYSRGFEAAMALERFKLLNNHPAINQDELVKDVVASNNPTAVKRLFVGTQAGQAREQDEASQSAVAMLSGFPIQVRPGQNHALRAEFYARVLQKAQVTGSPNITDEAFGLFLGAIELHTKALEQENAKAGAQLKKALRQIQAETRQATAQQQAAAQQQPPVEVGAEVMQ